MGAVHLVEFRELEFRNIAAEGGSNRAPHASRTLGRRHFGTRRPACLRPDGSAACAGRRLYESDGGLSTFSGESSEGLLFLLKTRLVVNPEISTWDPQKKFKMHCRRSDLGHPRSRGGSASSDPQRVFQADVANTALCS